MQQKNTNAARFKICHARETYPIIGDTRNRPQPVRRTTAADSQPDERGTGQVPSRGCHMSMVPSARVCERMKRRSPMTIRMMPAAAT